MIAACLRWHHAEGDRVIPRGGTTYYQVSWAGAVKLVGDIKGPASISGDGYLCLALGCQLPDDVGVFWVVG